jgi:transposase
MMKVQEVILKAMAGSLKWWEAAEIIGVSDRTMRRWRQRAVRSTGAGAEPQESADGVGTRVVGLYRGRYFDFNVRHFLEKLTEEHGLSISYTWVKRALQEAGLVKKRSRRGTHRRRGPRRALPGMLDLDKMLIELRRKFSLPGVAGNRRTTRTLVDYLTVNDFKTNNFVKQRNPSQAALISLGINL